MQAKNGSAMFSWKYLKSALGSRRFGLRLGNQRGSALVEFAMVLPMFMLVVTGIGSFGWALNNYLELTNAVTLAAENLAISPNAITDPCANVTSIIDGAAPGLNATEISTTTVITSGSTTQVSTSYSGSSCPAGAALLTNGDPVSVTATYPCTLSVYGNSFGCSLTAKVTEMAQ
jgi:Flp pilus assembly protein TadG